MSESSKACAKNHAPIHPHYQLKALLKQLSATQKQMLLNRMQMISEYNSGNRSNVFTLIKNNAIVFKGNCINDALDLSRTIEHDSLQQMRSTGKTSITAILFATTRTGNIIEMGRV